MAKKDGECAGAKALVAIFTPQNYNSRMGMNNAKSSRVYLEGFYGNLEIAPV